MGPSSTLSASGLGAWEDFRINWLGGAGAGSVGMSVPLVECWFLRA
jgi:hypothetical protein